MNLHLNRIVTLWIYLNHIMEKGTCSESKVYAINGCNATLEWELGNTSFVDGLSKIEIVSANGSRIAWVEGGLCEIENDASFYCKKWDRGECQFISVIFINVTSANSGNYMCRIRYGVGDYSSFVKEMIVIEQPQIVELSQIILNHPLDIECTIDGIFKGVKYQWKLNGTDLHSTERIYPNSSILRFERFCTADKSIIFSCEVCEQNSCCIRSESFALETYLSSTLASSHENDEVSCTLTSSHENHEAALSDSELKVLGTGLVFVAVVLVIAGFSILFILRHKYISKKTDFRTLDQPVNRSENREVTRQFLRFEHHDIPLPIPPVQEGACRRIMRSVYPNGHRNSRSLQTHLYHTKAFLNPVRKSLSLQTLMQLSSTIESCSGSEGCLNKTYFPKKYSQPCMEGLADGMRLDAQYAQFKQDRKECNDEHNTVSQCLSLNTPSPEHFEHESQEDLYNYIDEATCSIYNYALVNEHEANQQEDRQQADGINCEYDYATLPAL